MTWRDSASCLGLAHPWHDPWHPPESASNSTLYDEARSICEQCPVSRPCLTEAMAEESGLGRRSRHGMRAGTTPTQRWEADPNKPARHDDEDDE